MNKLKEGYKKLTLMSGNDEDYLYLGSKEEAMSFVKNLKIEPKIEKN